MSCLYFVQFLRLSEVRAAALAQQISDGLQNDTKTGSKDNRDDNDDDSDDTDGDDRSRCSPRAIDCAVFPFCCCARRVPRLMRVLLSVARPYLLRGAMFRCAADWTQIVNPLILSELIRASSGMAEAQTGCFFLISRVLLVVCR